MSWDADDLNVVYLCGYVNSALLGLFFSYSLLHRVLYDTVHGSQL
jgi:hypothetical protein